MLANDVVSEAITKTTERQIQFYDGLVCPQEAVATITEIWLNAAQQLKTATCTLARLQECPKDCCTCPAKDLVFDSLESIKALSNEKWEELGKPSLWLSVEVAGRYEVQKDYTQGKLRLMLRGAEVVRGKDVLVYDNIVVMDKETMSVLKYIWK